MRWEVYGLFHSVRRNFFYKSRPKKFFWNFFPKSLFIVFGKAYFLTAYPSSPPQKKKFENYEWVKLVYFDALNQNLNIRTETQSKQIFCQLLQSKKLTWIDKKFIAVLEKLNRSMGLRFTNYLVEVGLYCLKTRW